MTYLLGLIIATIAIIASITHLQQSYWNFVDYVGFAMVIGGTLAVVVITFPWKLYRDIWEDMKTLWINSGNVNHGAVLLDCIAFIKDGSRCPTNFSSRGLYTQILSDGQELLSLAFSKESIETILSQRIEQSYERKMKVANAFRGLAKYPPAFGLAGTVLGLVNIMRSISAGLDPKDTGTLMSVALMATLYGLIVANLIVNPAGELLVKSAGHQRKAAELAFHAVLLGINKDTLLESQEFLNSFVHPSQRIDLISSGREEHI